MLLIISGGYLMVNFYLSHFETEFAAPVNKEADERGRGGNMPNR
jgi:hypothetical protein